VGTYSVDDYHQMIAGGVLTEDDPIELLEGWLVAKMPGTQPHDIALEMVVEALAGVPLAPWRVRVQSALTTVESEPEPDLAVCTPLQQRQGRHPGPQDTALVIEVADTTLVRDRSLKQQVYARAAIPCYWIVNLVDRQVEVYTAPSGPTEAPAYLSRQDYREGNEVAVVILGKEVGRIPVAALLPA
jgi:hypothetical protein